MFSNGVRPMERVAGGAVVSPQARVESGGLGSISHDVDTFCKGSSRIVLRLGLPPKGDSKQIPTIFSIVRPHVLFLGSTLIGADLIAAKAIV